jgi:hypothetical protein
MAVLPAGHLVTQVFPATRLTSGPAEMTHASKRTEAAERDASSIGGVVARASEVRTVNRHDGDLGHTSSPSSTLPVIAVAIRKNSRWRSPYRLSIASGVAPARSTLVDAISIALRHRTGACLIGSGQLGSGKGVHFATRQCVLTTA